MGRASRQIAHRARKLRRQLGAEGGTVTVGKGGWTVKDTVVTRVTVTSLCLETKDCCRQ